jgi:hypothetical protein
MADGKLGAGAQGNLEVVAQARRKLERLHNLTEQYAVAKAGSSQDSVASLISRASLELGRSLLQVGLGVLADQANQMGMLARRGGGAQTKLRGMRDYVAQMRPGLDRAERSIITKDAESGAKSGEP